MADKLKPGISVRTTFVDGESPKAAKLNSLSSQLQNATQRLELAIGDLHSESYPYSALTPVHLGLEYGRNKTATGGLLNAPTRSLDVANLGRLVGPASNLSPHQMGSQEIVETVPTGVHEFSLRYPPEDSTALVFSDATVFATAQTVTGNLDSPGHYYVDVFGKVYSVSETNGGTVTYTYNPRLLSGGNAYQDASFNVIPDVNQCENGTGCSVGAIDANGRRPVTLPLATHHHYDVGGTAVTLTAADPLYNQQLYLPKILVDNWSLEEEIPGGFLYLKNYTKNVVYKDATYYYNSSTSILIGGKDITDDVDAGDTFCIVTVGTDITTSIDDLRKKLHHSHDRSFGEPLVPIQALIGALAEAGNSGVFAPSGIPGNYFPQYLHRDGFTSGVDANVNDENVMRGDLAMGVSGAAAGAHRTTGGATYKLQFWGTSSETRPYIHKDADEGLVLYADQEEALSVYIQNHSQGVRVRGGYLIPEKGIHSGLSGTEYAVKMIGFRRMNQPLGGASLFSFDLSDYGLNATDHKLLGVVLFARQEPAFVFHPPNDGGSYEWSFDSVKDYDYPASDFQVSLTVTGASWDVNDNIDVIGTVFFNELN